MQKANIPKGTRDFLPREVAKRNYIFSTIQSVFKKHAFYPIETPSFELSQTLLGKYGEEGDRLIFRILNSGEKVFKADTLALENKNVAKFANSISEKALRYDLTVPFARFVVQHQHELNFPFKRYQIQAVWRADRPQHGRYQEFYQCDADVVGSDSLIYEVEMIQLFDEILSLLQIPSFTIKINNRKILSGIAEISKVPDKLIDITVAIDKIDKIGEEAVLSELRTKNLSEEAISIVQKLLHISGNNEEKISQIKNFLKDSEEGLKGIDELEWVLNKIKLLGLKKAELEFDLSLARGLNYYTGAIFEVKANNVEMGSICGGGRYANLTELFGLKNMSGVGISFGADRIYDVLNTLNLFPKDVEQGIDFFFLQFGEEELMTCLEIMKQLREKKYSCDMYPISAKIQKQMKFANDISAKKVIIYGENERKKGILVLKDMQSGFQEEIKIKNFLDSI
ncbi:MAG: histidine--tRNA ligase [Flavobacteriia bacterium]|nr:histidine--tRNA ligase [Flavobacteriia bacterium]